MAVVGDGGLLRAGEQPESEDGRGAQATGAAREFAS